MWWRVFLEAVPCSGALVSENFEPSSAEAGVKLLAAGFDGEGACFFLPSRPGLPRGMR